MKDSPASSSFSDIAGRSRIIERIERDAGVPNLTEVLVDRLPPTDLQSLLLEVHGRRAKKRDPKELIKAHISNRFTRPSTASPTRLLEWDRIAFSRLPKLFQPIELSPVCPLGAGRGAGELRLEIETVGLHSGFCLLAVKKCLGTKTALRVAMSDFASKAARPTVLSGGVEKLQSAHKKVRIGIDQDRKQGRGDYGELCFKIFATSSKGREQELVDGGDVNWTQRLLNNAKERLIISGCGSERVCELFDPPASPKST